MFTHKPFSVYTFLLYSLAVKVFKDFQAGKVTKNMSMLKIKVEKKKNKVISSVMTFHVFNRECFKLGLLAPLIFTDHRVPIQGKSCRFRI